MRCLTAVLFALLFAACSDTSVVPDVVGPLSTPAFDFTNNPDNGNPQLYRFDDVRYGFLVHDPRTDLFALIQSAEYSYFGCITPPALFGFFHEQVWVDPTGATYPPRVWDLLLGKDIYIGVFEGGTAWDGSCADLNSRMLAEGPGHFVNTDNDFYAFARPSTNANAFGFVAQGQLETLDGERANFNAVSKCVWDGENPSSMKCVDKINFR